MSESSDTEPKARGVIVYADGRRVEIDALATIAAEVVVQLTHRTGTSLEIMVVLAMANLMNNDSMQEQGASYEALVKTGLAAANIAMHPHDEHNLFQKPADPTNAPGGAA